MKHNIKTTNTFLTPALTEYLEKKLAHLAHFINRVSLLNLVREEDLPVYNEKTGSTNQHKFYYYQDEDYRSDFSLLANNSSGLNLLPSHKQFNYFLVIQGAIPEEKTKQIVTQISKSIEGVQLAAIISQEPVKGLGALLQDLEIHLTDLKRAKAGNQKRNMPLAEDQ